MNPTSGWKRMGGYLVSLVVALAATTLPAGNTTPNLAPPGQPVPPIIEENYQAAVHDYKLKPDDNDAAVALAKACFDRAEFPRDNAERARLANEGSAVCRKLIARTTNFAPGHYYLAMNLAQLARTKLMGALPLLDEMATEWKSAITLDEKFDYAGPDRFLGLLYRDAPGWPVSLGDNGKARHYLERAARLKPNYPENFLNLAETYLNMADYNAAWRYVDKLRVLWPDAHKEFTGKYWDVSWKDWTQRYIDLQLELAKHPIDPPFRVDRRGNKR